MRWALGLVGLIYVVFLFPTPDYNAYNKDDASFFVTLAINLIEHGRYTVDTFPTDPYGHQASWPMVFPSLLAGVISVFGLSWVALKATMVALGLAGLVLLYRLFGGGPLARITVLLTALTPAYFLFSHVTMSEVPYLAMVAASLLAIEQSRTPRAALGAGVLAALTFLTRGYAITLLPTGVLFFVWGAGRGTRPRWTAALAFAVPIVVAVFGWSGYTSHVMATEPLDWISTTFGNGSYMYTEALRPAGQYAREFYWYHLRYPATFVLPFLSSQDLTSERLLVLTAVLLIPSAWGWWIAFRRARSAVVLWLPIALVLLVLNPIVSPRHWLAFVPFQIYFLLVAADAAAHRVRATASQRTAAAVAAGAIVATGLVAHLANPDALRFESPYWRQYRDLMMTSAEALPADAVIVVNHPHNAFVTAARRSYSLEDVTGGVWPPPVLRDEPHRYLACPTPALIDALIAETSAACTWLLTDPRFVEVDRRPLIVLYRDDGPAG